jgi:hypothetical protein
MLSDSQIIRLHADKEYRKHTQIGLSNLATDLIQSGKGDLKPDISLALKVAYKLFKARLIRKELAICSRDFLERLLNYELQLPRTPDSVKKICEANKENYLWMRYDIPRVEALFSHSNSLLSDATYRNLIKKYSTITGDKNARLVAITDELQQLLTKTKISISTKGIFGEIVNLGAEVYYAKNEEMIQQTFIKASSGGALGMLPEAAGDVGNG